MSICCDMFRCLAHWRGRFSKRYARQTGVCAFRWVERNYRTGKTLREFAVVAYWLLLATMNTASGYVLVFLGGGLGAAARHWVNRTSLAMVGPDYPAGTLAVNIIGSMGMGMLAAGFAFRGEMTTAPERLFLTTGVLGGFTTFSAFALDTTMMWERHDVGAALVYAG